MNMRNLIHPIPKASLQSFKKKTKNILIFQLEYSMFKVLLDKKLKEKLLNLNWSIEPIET